MIIAAAPCLNAADRCIDWQRVMARGTLAGETSGPIIVVSSFENYTKQPEDDWLMQGYPDLIARLLATARSARTRTGIEAIHDPLAARPDYIIGGTFRHMPNSLRIFIELKNGVDKKLLRMIEVNASYPDNAEFFSRSAAAVRDIAGTIGITFDEKAFDAVADATASTTAFENVERGRRALEFYDAAHMELAKIWFDQAKKADCHSWLGYESLVDLYTFQGLAAKTEGRPFIPFYQHAEEEFALMQKLGKRPPTLPPRGKPKPVKKGSGEIKLTNRFLQGNAAYLRGMSAVAAGDRKSAAKLLSEATKFVPEDARAWMELANVLTALGDATGSANARAKAMEIDTCLR